MGIVRLRWLLIPAAACAALAGFWLAHELDRETPRLASGTWLPQPRALADFALTDESGQAFTRAMLSAAPTLVYFGFSHCPDVCPTTLLKLAQLRRERALGGLRVLFVSVDPQRDTPEVLGRYVHAFDPGFHAATGTPQEIARVARNFGVAVSRVELPGGDYTMDHSAVLFLVARGGVAAVFTPPLEVPTLGADLRRIAPFLGSGRDAPAT